MFEFALIVLGGTALAVAVTALCQASRAAQTAQQAERKLIAHEAARRLAEAPEQPVPPQRRPWYLQPVDSTGKILAAVCAGVAAMATRQRSAFALAAATTASVTVAVIIGPNDEDTQAAPPPPRPLPADSVPGAFDLPRVPPSMSSSPAPTSTPASEASAMPSAPPAPPAPTDRQTPTSDAPAPADTDTDTTEPPTDTRTPSPAPPSPTPSNPTPRDNRDDARCINAAGAVCVMPADHPVGKLIEKTDDVLDQLIASNRSAPSPG